MAFVALWKSPEGTRGLLSVSFWSARESLQGQRRDSAVLGFKDVGRTAAGQLTAASTGLDAKYWHTT